MDSNTFWTSSNILTIIGIIVGAIIALWIFFKQKNRKRLEYKVIANESLLSYHKDVEKDLVILFQDKRIDNLALLILEFKNTGNIPVLKSDFESPLGINFKTPTRVFGTEVINAYPKNLDAFAIIELGGISISPCLINPKDKFSVKIIYDVKKVDYEIDARIAGIQNIEQTKQQINVIEKLAIIFVLMMFAGLLWIAFLFFKANDVFAGFGMLLVIAMINFGAYYNTKQGSK